MADLILGLSAFYHDSAAALVEGGTVVAAAQQERFSRRRHDRRFPADAVRECLRIAGARLSDVHAVAYHENPRAKFRRVTATWLAAAPHTWRLFRDTAPEWLSWKLPIRRTIRRELAALDLGRVPPVRTRQHHESHAASAFLPSPYPSAAVLCIDGVGEWATTTIWHGHGTRLDPVAELRFPHSLGLLYSAFTYFCGFRVDSGEYKLMGLAPYGTPRYAELIRTNLVDVKPDGSFRLDLRYFEYLHGQVMTGQAMERLLGGPRRQPESELTQRECDLAASVQQVTEDIVLRLAHAAIEQTGEKRLCMAGGVALNCTANGRLAREWPVWIQPAAGDAGCALGAALATAVERGAGRPHVSRSRDAMAGALLGPAYSETDIHDFLTNLGAPYHRVGVKNIAERVAAELAAGRVVGWFQGRMEFGPRALGARSILGDPRDPTMHTRMNLKIKYRESFRPFAPAVLDTAAGDYFDLPADSPYMLLVAELADRQLTSAHGTRMLGTLSLPRSTLPAVTHVDLSARVQTVSAATNPLFHQLLTEFHRITGCPVLVNTSFNVRGEPIVNDPRDAYTCFMRTGIDVLAMDGFLLDKATQPTWREDVPWRDTIPLD